MTYLVLTLCLASAPDNCMTREYPLYEASLMTCVMQGHTAIPKLIEARPGVVVREWRCK